MPEQQIAGNQQQDDNALVDDQANLTQHDDTPSFYPVEQTVWHSPRGHTPFSLQLGAPHPISRAISAPIVFDFRNSHIQAGGEGAPLLPPFHAKMYAFQQKSIVLNIGGISNYTLVSGASFFGSDIGPGSQTSTHCRAAE